MNKKYTLQALGFAFLAHSLTITSVAAAEQPVVLTERQLDTVTAAAAGRVIVLGHAEAMAVGTDSAFATAEVISRVLTITSADSSFSNRYWTTVDAEAAAEGDVYAGADTLILVTFDDATVIAQAGGEAGDGGSVTATLTTTGDKKNNITKFKINGEVWAIGDDPSTWADADYIAPDGARVVFREMTRQKPTKDGGLRTWYFARLIIKEPR